MGIRMSRSNRRPVPTLRPRRWRGLVQPRPGGTAPAPVPQASAAEASVSGAFPLSRPRRGAAPIEPAPGGARDSRNDAGATGQSAPSWDRHRTGQWPFGAQHFRCGRRPRPGAWRGPTSPAKVEVSRGGACAASAPGSLGKGRIHQYYDGPVDGLPVAKAGPPSTYAAAILTTTALPPAPHRRRQAFRRLNHDPLQWQLPDPPPTIQPEPTPHGPRGEEAVVEVTSADAAFGFDYLVGNDFRDECGTALTCMSMPTTSHSRDIAYGVTKDEASSRRLAANPGEASPA